MKEIPTVSPPIPLEAIGHVVGVAFGELDTWRPASTRLAARGGGVFVQGEQVGPAERTRGVMVVEPALQAVTVEEVAAGEAVHHRVPLEPAEADAAVLRVATRIVEPVGRAESDRLDPAPEPVRQGVARRAGEGARVAVRVGGGGAAEADDIEEEADDPLEDRDGEGSVHEEEGENGLRWRRQAVDPHRDCQGALQIADYEGSVICHLIGGA